MQTRQHQGGCNTADQIAEYFSLCLEAASFLFTALNTDAGRELIT